MYENGYTLTEQQAAMAECHDEVLAIIAKIRTIAEKPTLAGKSERSRYIPEQNASALNTLAVHMENVLTQFSETALY